MVQPPVFRAVPRYRDWLRNAVYLGLGTCAAPWIAYRLVAKPRAREGLGEKLCGISPDRLAAGLSRASDGVPAPEAAPPRPLWLHGVSVGEVQLLKPLAEHLSRSQPAVPVAVSTTTASGMELAQRLFQEIDLFYFPFDLTWAVARSMDAIQPAMIALGELELWPNLIAEANRRGIPIAVVNGRMSDTSFRGYRRLRPLVQGMFRGLSLVAAQSETYAQRFIACGCPPHRVHVTGNTKFDNVAFDREHPRVERLRRLVGLAAAHRVVVAGSTQASEESAAVEALRRLRRLSSESRLIVVPRHPDRFEQAFAQLAETEFRVRRRSQIVAPISADAWDILLVDTVGELRWWWGLAEIALVGGSFGQRGGQNMLEPAAYGANVLFGPNTSNFRDVVEQLLAARAVRVIPSLDELPAVIVQEFANPEPGRQRGVRARETVAMHQGALQRTADLLVRLLAASTPRPNAPATAP